jgi:N4-gp56 family major capsid protein
MNKILLYTMAAGATPQYTEAVLSSANPITAITATDVLTVSALRKAVLTLKTNKAPRWENGVFRAVLSAQGNYELQGDSAVGNFTTINVSNTPENVNEVKSGEIRRIAGIDCKESDEQYTQSSTVTVYSSFVAGKGAVAEIDIAGSGNYSIMHEKAGGTSNPLHMFDTLGWKVDAYAAKVLNANWIVNILHA